MRGEVLGDHHVFSIAPFLLQDLGSAASSALALLRTEELQQLDPAAREAAAGASRLCEQLSLAGDVASHLELGEGLTALLTRLGPYLERAELQYQVGREGGCNLLQGNRTYGREQRRGGSGFGRSLWTCNLQCLRGVLLVSLLSN
jgi:hypothetical protein